MLRNRMGCLVAFVLVVCALPACNLSQPPRSQRQVGPSADADEGLAPTSPPLAPPAAVPDKPRRVMGLKAMQGLSGNTIPAPLSIQAERNAAEQRENPNPVAQPNPSQPPAEPPLVPVPPAPTFKVSPIPVIVVPPKPPETP